MKSHSPEGEAEALESTRAPVISDRSDFVAGESEQWRRIIDGLGPNMFVGLLEPNGKVIEINQSALISARLKRSDVVGMRFEETYWWTHSEDVRARLRAAIERAAAGVPSRYDEEIRVGEHEYLKIDFSLQPLRGEFGEALFLVLSAIDVTERVRAEAALRESEARLRSAQEQAGVGSWELDLASERGRWSDTMFALFGLQPSRGEPNFSEFLELVHPEDRAAVMNLNREVVKRPGSHMLDLRTNPRLGPVRHLSNKVECFFDPEENPLRLVGTTIDVTERKLIEIKLRQEEERYLNQRNALIALTRNEGVVGGELSDALKRITEVTARTLGVERVSIWRYSPGLHSIRCLDLFEAKANLHSAGLELFESQSPAYFKALAEKRFIAATDALRDSRTCELDETYLKPAGITSTLDAPIHVAGGIDGVLCNEHTGSAREWTPDEKTFALAISNLVSLALAGAEKRQAELRREEMERSLDTLLSNLPGMVYRTHDGEAWNMEFVSAGAVALTGFEPEQLIGDKSIRYGRRINPEDHLNIERQVQDAVDAGRAFQLTYRIKTAGGDEKWVWEQGNAVRGPDGKVEALEGFITDITDQKRLEQQFLRAQRMESIGTLAGGIAHDLNNALSPIMMSINLLKLRFDDPESLELLDIISTSAERGADMVRQVLSFGRGVEGLRVEVQLKHLIKDIAKLANETFLKHITVRTDVEAGLWPILGDPTQVHQVLLNLCLNARDAMPQGGAVTITAENRTLDENYAAMNIEATPGRYVLVQVEDNGTGIPSGILEKIFDPFFTTKELGKGTGLGLSTSLGIVKSHGGFMRVYSELGRGSKFGVYLPAHVDGSGAMTPEMAAELPRGQGELILVVDDEASIRQITRQTLETFGYQVVLANDGAEAIANFVSKRAEIAAVLTDMMMPVMDGPATIQVLLKMSPDLPIIASSGLSAEAQIARAKSLGVRHFIPKPYTAEALLTILHEILGPKRASRGG